MSKIAEEMAAFLAKKPPVRPAPVKVKEQPSHWHQWEIANRGARPHEFATDSWDPQGMRWQRR